MLTNETFMTTFCVGEDMPGGTDSKKSKVVGVRFKIADYDVLEEQAQVEGLSVAAHVRRLVILILQGEYVPKRQAGYAKSKGWE